MASSLNKTIFKWLRCKFFEICQVFFVTKKSERSDYGIPTHEECLTY